MTSTSVHRVSKGACSTGRARFGVMAGLWPPHSGFSKPSAPAGTGLGGGRGAKYCSTSSGRPVISPPSLAGGAPPCVALDRCQRIAARTDLLAHRAEADLLAAAQQRVIADGIQCHGGGLV